MTDLLLAVGFLIGIGCWLVPASRRDARGTAAAQLGRPAFGGRRTVVGVVVVALRSARAAHRQTANTAVAGRQLDPGTTGIVLMLVVIGWAAT